MLRWVCFTHSLAMPSSTIVPGDGGTRGERVTRPSPPKEYYLCDTIVMMSLIIFLITTIRVMAPAMGMKVLIG